MLHSHGYWKNQSLPVPVGALVEIETTKETRHGQKVTDTRFAVIYAGGGRWNTEKGGGVHTYECQYISGGGGFTGDKIVSVLIPDTGVRNILEAVQYMNHNWQGLA